jgi:hypothetical protein
MIIVPIRIAHVCIWTSSQRPRSSEQKVPVVFFIRTVRLVTLLTHIKVIARPANSAA